MNIDQYRAMKAQEEAQQNSAKEQTDAQTQQSATEPVSQEPQATQQSEPTPTTTTTQTDAQTPPSEPTTSVPQTFHIEGIGDVSLEELQKGYLRQSDYTKKTQQVAQQRKEVEQAVSFFEQIKSNPDVAQQLSEQFPELNPEQLRMKQLEQQYHDLLLEREVERLQSKYEDFDVREVLQVAYDKKLENIEDAYLLVKANKPSTTNQETPTTPSFDIEQVKAQLRQELKQELELELGTTSIIQSGGATPPTTQDTPTLSDAERKVARMMKLSDADYVKWRDQK